MNRIFDNIKKIRKRLSEISSNQEFAGWFFAMPVILGFLVFVLGPILVTVLLSMSKYVIGSKPEFIGFKNYEYLLSGKDPFFYPSIKATFYYVFLSVPLGIIFSYAVALLLNQKIKGRSFFRGVFYLPVVIPLAASSMVWLWILQPDFGIVNYFLKTLHLPPSPWLASEQTVIPTLVLFSLWLSGNTIVIFLAGLQEVPTQLYEAVEVDGGNAWHKLIHITIPMTSPIIFFNTVMAFINAFQTFVQPYIMTSGGQSINMGAPNNASLLYVLNLYREAFRFSNFGNASAQAVLLFIVILGITFILFKISRRYVYYEGETSK
ncbi:MAG: sugar ABC transporter permease [Anaeromicrobium sp.]|jgi:multiple sugar transport system permease protein|uniref:carbohydrate ABC transporter permease n=1 Tax=Anaeromicrobium sp. TaxID=1929132 RepID=UPI0025D3C6E8|nr:sugar ABC transporter permease [Anaeromicrobium sp.]MCT4593713.1 sugar ABC transporter permease [Anaeromicrobium sp.]